METEAEALINRFNRGERLKFLFFWGHRSKGTEVGKECLSQWYPAAFEVAGERYSTTEHYMMAEKARLFDSEDIRKEIIAAGEPGAAKDLGRRVTNFSEAEWLQHRVPIVKAGNLAKFSQNPALGSFLTGTGSRVLVEASPRDRIWGIGLAQDDPACENPNKWRGLNLLGFALMSVREKLTTN